MEQYEKTCGTYPTVIDWIVPRDGRINPIDGEEKIQYRFPGVHNPGRFDVWCSDASGNSTGIRNWP